MKSHINIKEDMVLIAGPKSSLYTSANVFNLNKLGPEFHIKLDKYVHLQFRLMRIYNIDTKDLVCDYHYDEFTHPWVDIAVDHLDKSEGLHTYAIEFINSVTGDTFYQYFNYTIQNDNPDKPYIYMNR